jgi:hypothetical protein
MQKYWEERDSWQAKDKLPPKWTGTNIGMAFQLLWRNGGLEDHATMQRLCADKRWEHSRHHLVVCKACTGDFRGLIHPLLKCGNLQLCLARTHWKEDCYTFVNKHKNIALRSTLLEILHHAFNSPGGEHACLGAFLPSWAKHLDDGKVISATDLRTVKKFLKVLVSGARIVMREYARIKEVAEGDAKELRQLSMVEFTKAVGPRPLKPKTTVSQSIAETNLPPDDIWALANDDEDSSTHRASWTPSSPASDLPTMAALAAPHLPSNIETPHLTNTLDDRLLRSIARANRKTPWDQFRRKPQRIYGVNSQIMPCLGSKPPVWRFDTGCAGQTRMSKF